MTLDSGSARKRAHPGMTANWVDERSETHLLIRGKAMDFTKGSTYSTGYSGFRIQHVLLTIRPLKPILSLNGSGFLGRRCGSG
jgi:hypothetical protein